jgi:hypothetical protein
MTSTALCRKSIGHPIHSRLAGEKPISCLIMINSFYMSGRGQDHPTQVRHGKPKIAAKNDRTLTQVGIVAGFALRTGLSATL